MLGPDFVIAGGHKCGTTSLHSALGQHPDLNMSEVKEPHFFIRDVWRTRNGVFDPDEYSAVWDSSKGGFRGEASVLYLYFAQAAIRTMDQTLTGMPKVIVIVRNPVERAYSSFWDARLKNPDETARSFESAVAREFQRGPWRLDGTPTLRHLALSRYSEGIAAFMSAVGTQNVHLVLFDDLIENREQTLVRIQEFIGVKPNESVTNGFATLNGGRRIWSSSGVAKLARSRAAVAARHGLRRVAPGAHQRATTFAMSALTDASAPMSDVTRAELEHLYHSEIARLRSYFDVRADWLKAGL